MVFLQWSFSLSCFISFLFVLSGEIRNINDVFEDLKYCKLY